MPIFVLLFLVVPFIEIFLLIQVGQQIGALPTVALCVLTAVLGGALLRQQGAMTWARAQQRLSRGELPADDMMGGIALAVGGALLVTPGFATDAIGFLLLLPQSRARIIRAVMKRMKVISVGGSGPVHRGRDGHDVIEGEYERRD